MPLQSLIAVTLAAATIAGMATRLRAETPESGAARVVLPTLGGKQFWTDVLCFHDWRIQHNSWYGHYRLLDGDNFCQASGTYEQCTAVLDRIKVRQKLPPMHGKAVILLHGLCRTRSSMTSLADYLKEQGGYTVFNLSYASTQTEIAEQAKALKQVLDHLDGIDEVNFVAHSLGNIVIRHYLGDNISPLPYTGEGQGVRGVATGKGPAASGVDPRIKRIVMLAPPNHQPQMAVQVGDMRLFKMATGEAGQQLGRDWAKLEPRLAAPACEFGILAGGKGNDWGYSPLLPGDNDGTVTVAGTRLKGAADFRLVHVGHTFIMEDEAVMKYTLRFLQEGCFTTEAERERIGR